VERKELMNLLYHLHQQENSEREKENFVIITLKTGQASLPIMK